MLQGIVYLDILVFVNAIIAYFLLRAVSFLSSREKYTCRIALASLFAGLSSLTMLLTNIYTVFLLVTKILCAVLIILIAFKYKNVRVFLKSFFYFFLLNIILGGVVVLCALSGLNAISMQNYSVYINISPVLLIGCILLMYVIICAVSYIFGKSTAAQSLEFKVILQDGTKISGMALIDSGMHIKDSMTQSSAILCSYAALKTQLSGNIKTALDLYFEKQELTLPLWLVNVKTATGAQMLPTTRAQSISFTQSVGEKQQIIQREKPVLVFTSETILDGSYDVILSTSYIKER